MQLLLVSDLHYTLKQFDWVCQNATHFDVVVIAGDHLDIMSVAALEAQIVVISKYLQRIQSKTRLVVSSGNHDLDQRDPSGERVATWLRADRFPGMTVDGQFMQIDNLKITVCPWWDGPVGRDAVGAQLARDAEQRPARWIWVYHAPPDRSQVSWGGKQHYGDVELRKWIEAYQPDIVLSGHIHESPFRSGGSWVDRIGNTWIFNAGRQIGPCPTCIVFDFGNEKVSWHSFEAQEEIRLDKPLERPVAEFSPR